MRQMADPKFARAIEFMQRDPAACKEYYQKHDPKLGCPNSDTFLISVSDWLFESFLIFFIHHKFSNWKWTSNWKFFAEFIGFFQENMKRIAGHMDKRASQQNAQGDTNHLTSQDERKMKDIMSR